LSQPGDSGTQLEMPLPWNELTKLRVASDAKACGMSVPNFIVECLRRFSEMTSQVVQREMRDAQAANSKPPAEDAGLLVQLAASDEEKQGPAQ
jgi:hypothetical protein